MTDRHVFDDVDTFTAATEGRPGQRVFYLQVRSGASVITVKCEKGQVEALGRYFGRELTDLPQPESLPHPSLLEPATPLLSEFIAGTITLAFDKDADRFVVDVEEALAVDEEGQPDPEEAARQGAVRFRMDRAQAYAFASRAAELVAAGRPPCRFCGGPLDPEGHACPRMN